MKEVKASTKRGQDLIKKANSCCYPNLSYLYTTWSQAKENAFNKCFEMYLKSDNSADFGVGNANTFGFSASWFCTINGEECYRLETKDNSYIIWFNR